MEMWYMLVLAGALCGVFSAMFGVGSGIIMVPLLVLWFDFSQKSAQGMSLAVMVPMALMGAIRYKMTPAVSMDMKMVLLIAIGGVLGAWLGVYLVNKCPGLLLRRVFAVIMIVTAVKMFFTPAAGADKARKVPSVVESAPGS